MSGGPEVSVEVWNKLREIGVREFEKAYPDAKCVSYNRVGKYLAISKRESAIHIWDLE